jgi:hydroxylamine reductase
MEGKTDFGAGGMFCFQCEQTAGGKGCVGRAGACGKPAACARLQDELTGELVRLSQAALAHGPTGESDRALLDGLFATLTNVNFDDAQILRKAAAARAARGAIAGGPGAANGAGGAGGAPAGAFDMRAVWGAPEDERSLATIVLLGARGAAAYAHHAAALGGDARAVCADLYKGLAALDGGAGEADGGMLGLALLMGKATLAAMELLDAANTGAFGAPAPTRVPMDVEPGPFVVVSGHDLRDLDLLLAQAEGRGVAVYTHGEMLPAHAYPGLAKRPCLKGNFGTAWQNQQKEFDGIPGAVLFTSNCIIAPRPSYKDRVFTTGPAGFPGCAHVGEGKDFSPVIERALALGGYGERRVGVGANGGSAITTGFGHAAVLGAADRIVGLVKSGAIRRFLLVGGCDGARPGRSYYTELARLAPQDTLILTLGCGKFRFHDLDLGEIGGFPRVLDMGQCNDAYSAIKVALALADAFGCGVNDLPLSIALSWFEQKAVGVLLALLHLGIKGIRVGPSLPAFASPAVLGALADRYGLAPVTTPERDLAAFLAA